MQNATCTTAPMVLVTRNVICGAKMVVIYSATIKSYSILITWPDWVSRGYGVAGNAKGQRCLGNIKRHQALASPGSIAKASRVCQSYSIDPRS